ncbi:Ribonuclease H superfamily [Sesbania bispinosa]|nr:Ribonuclease H superfamily [Sesbania bispinosa]
MALDSRCQRCDADVEDSIHCLRDCPQASSFWFRFGFNTQWCWRNASVIGGLNRDINLAINRVSFSVHDWKHLTDVKITQPSSSMVVVWEPPLVGLLSLIRMAAVLFSPQCWELEELFGTQQLVGLRVFSGNAGRGKSCVESDSLKAVHLVSTHTVSSFHLYDILLAKITNLLRRDWVVQIKHIYREGNHGADAMAKLGVSQAVSFHTWTSPPPCARLALFAGRNGMIHLR